MAVTTVMILTRLITGLCISALPGSAPRGRSWVSRWPQANVLL